MKVRVLVADEIGIVQIIDDYLKDVGEKFGLDFEVFQARAGCIISEPQVIIADPYWATKIDPCAGIPAMRFVRDLKTPVIFTSIFEIPVMETSSLRFLRKPEFHLGKLKWSILGFLGITPKLITA